MAGVRVISVEPVYVPLVHMLYPEYAIVSDLSRFARFILKRDITSLGERQSLDSQYEDCIILSSRIFDEVWTPEIIIGEVLSFARVRFGSRKKVLRPEASSGQELVDELRSWLFFGEPSEEESMNITDLFAAYGSRSFHSKFLELCRKGSVGQYSASMETFISKVLGGSESLFYKKAAMRLSSLGKSTVSALEDFDNIDPFYRKHFKDLCNLRLYTMLMRGEYYG